jgi:DNA-binding MarR family transcriptional regulator
VAAQTSAPLTPDEEGAWRALARAVLVIPRVLDGELLASEGLNLSEYTVLMNLSEQPDLRMRMTELANVASLTSSGLTRVVDRLARHGLVERRKAPTDGRGNLAVLTPDGLARLEKAYLMHLAGVRKHVMDHLVDLDLGSFADVISRIAEAEVGPPVRRVAPAMD